MKNFLRTVGNIIKNIFIGILTIIVFVISIIIILCIISSIFTLFGFFILPSFLIVLFIYLCYEIGSGIVSIKEKNGYTKSCCKK